MKLTINFQFFYLHFVFRHQPDIAVKKTKVKGRDISSAPDVICYGMEGNISCIVKVLHVFVIQQLYIRYMLLIKFTMKFLLLYASKENLPSNILHVCMQFFKAKKLNH